MLLIPYSAPFFAPFASGAMNDANANALRRFAFAPFAPFASLLPHARSAFALSSNLFFSLASCRNNTQMKKMTQKPLFPRANHLRHLFSVAQMTQTPELLNMEVI